MAANYIQKAIQVQRLQENLRLRPNCSSISSACGSECNCGSLLNTFSCGEFVTVPQEHIGTRTVCKNSICQPDGPNGVGVSDTDLLIYVTANESGIHYLNYLNAMMVIIVLQCGAGFLLIMQNLIVIAIGVSDSFIETLTLIAYPMVLTVCWIQSSTIVLLWDTSTSVLM